MNQPFDPYAAPKAAVVGYAPSQAATTGTPIDFTGQQVLLGAFAVFKKRWQELLLVYFVFFLIMAGALVLFLGPAFASGAFDTTVNGIHTPGTAPGLNPGASLGLGVGGLVFAVMMVVLLPGLMRVSLNAVHNEPVEISVLFSERRHWARYLGLGMWTYLVFVVSFVTLFIYGFWWLIATMPVWFLIVDKNLGVFEGIRVAKEMTAGRRMSIWGAYGWMFLATIVIGIAAAFLGFLSPVLSIIATIVPRVVLQLVGQLMPAWMYAAMDGTLPPEYENQN